VRLCLLPMMLLLITKWQLAPSVIGGLMSCWWFGDCCWNCHANLLAWTLSLASGGSCSLGVLCCLGGLGSTGYWLPLGMTGDS
jgi:hypothetical protein